VALIVIRSLQSTGHVDRTPRGRSRTRSRLLVKCALALFALVVLPTIASAQPRHRKPARTAMASAAPPAADPFAFPIQPASQYRSRADSLTSVRIRKAADRALGLRIVISLNDRQLWVLLGYDTLLVAPVAVSTDATLEYAGKTWRFETPRGLRAVLAKTENPVWIPPEWHYAEVASEHGLKLATLSAEKPTKLSDGSRLVVRDKEVGIVRADSDEYEPMRLDEEIVFDETLFIPPIGTLNRRIEGELGYHMLDTGNGFLLHGTPHKASIGTAATHGCIRLRDADIQWLYEMVPVSTPVYIY
jgi:L,D-transpeptidase catalytic domain